ncbi:spore germination protein [Paenibacillus sp. PAMC21692]|uniref:spore germination protein n=1 Tax=Paenibacillus sp. PAMC21692 TaxID=2762320 RepID=UPI00164E4681|nr:spore germination protein [Paenibacillus sp. PAMC21692]QNK58300.1 spore germination protein [Paenibacillus sp. PAMC21692]
MFGMYMSKKAGKDQKKERRSPGADKHVNEQMKDYEHQPIVPVLTELLDKIKKEMGESSDLIIRGLNLTDHQGKDGDKDIALVYIQGLVEDERLDKFVIQTMQQDPELPSRLKQLREHDRQTLADSPEEPILSRIKSHLIAIGLICDIKTFKDLFEKLFLGYALIFIDGSPSGIGCNVYGGPKRSVEEPKTEMMIRGPREGFTESLRVNTILLRRKIRSPKLWLEQMKVGEITQTPVAIMYIKGLADESVIEDLKRRIKDIKNDGILESSYIEEMITDQKWTPFPTIISHERPDVIASNLLDGRVAIIVDGTPFVLVVPSTLNMFFQAAEDYYQNYQMATFLRMLRFSSFFIALLMPSIYVAIIGYHQEMIPTQLLLKLAAQREGVPFPAYLEAFIMELVFEILREAVLRMPSTAGSAISIVGGLVIGQSIVEAGIVSSAVVIVVAFTAISSFVAPIYSLGIAARLLRFLLLVAASTLGFYGIALVMLLILLHMSNLSSFGIPYLKPFAPFNWKDFKDTLLRVPLWMMKERPQQIGDGDQVRDNSAAEPRREPSQ